MFRSKNRKQKPRTSGSSTPTIPPSTPELPAVAASPFIVAVSNILCSNLPSGPLRRYHFYALVSVDGINEQTAIAERASDPWWKTSFRFDVSSEWSMNVQFFATHTLQQTELIAELDSPILAVDLREPRAVVRRELLDCRDRSGTKLPGAVVHLTLEVTSRNAAVLCLAEGNGISVDTNLIAMPAYDAGPMPTEGPAGTVTIGLHQAKHTVNQANEAITTVFLPSAATQEVIGTIVDAGTTVDKGINTWDPLLKHIEKLVDMTGTIAEIHPFAGMAWRVLSAVPKPLVDQMHRDEHLGHLLSSMNDAYELVTGAGTVSALNNLNRQSVVQRLVEQTTECAYFIYDYAAHRSLLRRTVTHAFSNADSCIEEFKRCFQEIKSAIVHRTAVSTERLVWRVVSDVQRLAERDILNQMQYADGASGTAKDPCLPNTRVTVLKEITDWVTSPNTDDVPRVFWLRGVAGSGKSAIALSIRDYFSDVSHLGSAFFFDRSHADRTPSKLFSTISHDLADLIPAWRTSLSKILERSQALRTTLEVREQWNSFMLEPASELAQSSSAIRRVVIVIDAVDESVNSDDREIMLSILKDFGRLPSCFRVLVTSRPDEDIASAFAGNSRVRGKDMATLDRLSAHDDVMSYVKHNLPTLGESAVAGLVEKSASHFQWIAAACRFIAGRTNASEGWSIARQRVNQEDHSGRLTVVLNGSTFTLDALYTTILKETFGYALLDEDFLKEFRIVLGRVLYVREPLTLSALDSLQTEGEDAVLAFLQPLSALLQGVSGENSLAVRPLHMSFRDYLSDRSRSGKLSVEHDSAHDARLAHACLYIMDDLNFNMCKLSSSYLRNDQVEDLGERIALHIPEVLRYACRWWPYHVMHAQPSLALSQRLKKVLEEKFLYWLEVMSLCQEINTTLNQLIELQKWSQTNSPAVYGMLATFCSFLQTYASAIHISTPHLYISALPLAQNILQICPILQQQFPGTLELMNPSVLQQPVCLSILCGHTDWIPAVAFSPDSQLIVSGSLDKTLRIWDAKTGTAVGPPLQGHSRGVRSVAFSPDGQYIVSGSEDRTLCIWDTKTGTAVGPPLEGHSDWVNSVAFSPDGQHIVSGSLDMTLCIWDAKTGTAVGHPLRGHSNEVVSVAFSPDGQYIVSGSRDKTLRIWDARTGAAVGSPIGGHSEWVSSVAFSPDGQYIVSGSWDTTLCIWDARTGAAVGSPLEGHSHGVRSVAFSPDGQHIVSGSLDGTLRIWDAKTGAAVGLPLEGHSDEVLFVAYSPDGQCIVSGSADAYLCIWDAPTQPAMSPPMEGHSDAVISVAFPSDGQCIVSGSMDRSLHIWDVNAGTSPLANYLPGPHSNVSVIPAFASRDHGICVPLFSSADQSSGTYSEWLPSTLPPSPPLTAFEFDKWDCWFKGPAGELLLWLPPTCREGLQTMNVGKNPTLHLDLTHFVHGELWERCHVTQGY